MEQGLARPDGLRAPENISKHSASFFQAPRSWTSRQMNSANGLPKSIVCKNLSGLQTLPWSPSHSSMPLSLCMRTSLRSTPGPSAARRAGQAWGAGRSRHSCEHGDLRNDSRSKRQKRLTRCLSLGIAPGMLIALAALMETLPSPLRMGPWSVERLPMTVWVLLHIINSYHLLSNFMGLGMPEPFLPLPFPHTSPQSIISSQMRKRRIREVMNVPKSKSGFLP